jgi:hypothetical protein
MYGQMLLDLKMLPAKTLYLLVAPRMILVFIKNTSFRYGPSGLESFSLYQKAKKRYLL